MKRSQRRIIWLSTSCLAVMGAADAMAKELTLRIEPEQGTAYTARCTLETGSGRQTHEFSGAELLERTFQGDSLSCRIVQTSEGSLVIDLTSSTGSSSRSSTSGGSGALTMVSIS